jgi:hypothetical protein
VQEATALATRGLGFGDDPLNFLTVASAAITTSRLEAHAADYPAASRSVPDPEVICYAFSDRLAPEF